MFEMKQSWGSHSLGGARLQEHLQYQGGGSTEDSGTGYEKCLVAQPVGGDLVAGERQMEETDSLPKKNGGGW